MKNIIIKSLYRWLNKNNFAKEAIAINRLLFGSRPKAFIVPHASEEYSGHVAIEVLKKISDYDYSSIVLLGLDHDSDEYGIYTGSKYSEDLESIATLKDNGFEDISGDHSIGHLIPLIERFSDLPLCPIVVNKDIENITEALKNIINDDTLVIASTDLSHYNDADTAGEVDRETISSIVSGKGNVDMCGLNPVQVLLGLFQERPRLVDYDNSSHLKGDKNRVVGYAAFQIGGFSDEILDAENALIKFLQNPDVMPSDNSDKKLAAFIGISRNGELQGSVGQTRPVLPYKEAVISAFLNTLEDSRMQHNPDEIFEKNTGFSIKIRFFTEQQETRLEDVIIGKDGIYVEGKDNKSAVFLPEVPTKQGWELNTYLTELLKKGEIMPNEDYVLYKFQTEALTIFN